MRSVILALAVAALGAAAPAAQAQVDPFIGTWRISAVLAMPEYAALTQPQARLLVGRTIEIARTRVQVWAGSERQPQQDVCMTPEFQIQQANRARMLADYRMRPEDLTALPASFSELTVTCRGNFLAVLRPIGANALIAEIETVFFRVERTATPPGAAATQGTPAQGSTTQTALGPSFNCAQARRADEQAICADAGLARSDRQLAESFGKLAAATPEAQREALRREQRDWVADRAKQCNVAADARLTDANRAQLTRCLAGVYAARIRDLDYRLQRAQR